MKKPVIGLTTVEQLISISPAPSRRATLLNTAYVTMVCDHNATPILLSSQTSLKDIPTLCEKIDGLVIIGGSDMDPGFYHQNLQVEYANLSNYGSPGNRPLSCKPDRRRDEFELELYAQAQRLKIPIFGICRGLQLINVAEGGTLFQELPKNGVIHYFEEDGWIHHHPITLDPDSQAANIMGISQYFASSIHHQGVDRLGSGLTKSAWADDGIAEIIERIDGDQWIVAVQGHVEQTRKNLSCYDKLLAAFIAESQRRA